MGLTGMLRTAIAKLGAIAKLQQLRRGMTPAEVTALLGEPKQVEQLGEQRVWSYSLHQWMKGFVPVHLAFDGVAGTLSGWMVDEAQFQRNQAQWMAALAQLQQMTGGGAGGPGSASAGGGTNLAGELASQSAWRASGAGNWHSR